MSFVPVPRSRTGSVCCLHIHEPYCSNILCSYDVLQQIIVHILVCSCCCWCWWSECNYAIIMYVRGTRELCGCASEGIIAVAPHPPLPPPMGLLVGHYLALFC